MIGNTLITYVIFHNIFFSMKTTH